VRIHRSSAVSAFGVFLLTLLPSWLNVLKPSFTFQPSTVRRALTVNNDFEHAFQSASTTEKKRLIRQFVLGIDIDRENNRALCQIIKIEIGHPVSSSARRSSRVFGRGRGRLTRKTWLSNGVDCKVVISMVPLGGTRPATTAGPRHSVVNGCRFKSGTRSLLHLQPWNALLRPKSENSGGRGRVVNTDGLWIIRSREAESPGERGLH
jgi:hypothetical protein